MKTRILTDISDIVAFLVYKTKFASIGIKPLPQVRSLSRNTSWDSTEWIIEWDSKALDQDIYKRDNFLVLYLFGKDHSISQIHVFHICGLDYSFYPTSVEPGICYRCASVTELNDEEKRAVAIIQNIFGGEMYGCVNYSYGMLMEPEKTFNLNEIVKAGMNSRPGLITCMPIIIDIYYNAPYTTVKWSDNTVTTVKATDGEEFNKELGLAMAISRKFYECLGFAHPRAAFKRMVENAHDQTAKTTARKEYRKSRKLLKSADISTEKDSSDGHNTNL